MDCPDRRSRGAKDATFFTSCAHGFHERSNEQDLDQDAYLLTAKEGGRTKPIREGYRPQLFVGAIDVTATIHADTELAPGGHAEVNLDLDRAVALEPGVRFALREGGKTIGAGVVTTVM